MATVETIPAATSEPDFLYEIVDGEITEIPYMGAYAGIIASILLTHLNQYGWKHRLGHGCSDVLFRLKPAGNARRPDVAFVKFDRYPIFDKLKVDPATLEIVPSIAGEVVSPTNTATEIEAKVQEYLEAGVEIVWVIYPAHRRIHVFESMQNARILSDSDELDGGNVLPNFRLPVHSLFEFPVAP